MSYIHKGRVATNPTPLGFTQYYFRTYSDEVEGNILPVILNQLNDFSAISSESNVMAITQ